MSNKVTVKKEIAVKYVTIDAAVRYDDEDMPYDAPMREGKSWIVTVDLDTHKIENWPIGKTLDFYMKVCDEGIYCLLDAERNEIDRIEGYVPNKLLPGNYGDYLGLKIDGDGVITNWLTNASFDDFENER